MQNLTLRAVAKLLLWTSKGFTFIGKKLWNAHVVVMESIEY